MRALSPEGRVYQAGTLSGNPLSMAAGKSVLSRLSAPLYRELEHKTRAFVGLLEATLGRQGTRVSIHQVGSMFTVFYADRTPVNFSDVRRSDARAFRRAFHRLLRRGVYVPPSAFEASFVSAAHTADDLKKTLDAYRSIE